MGGKGAMGAMGSMGSMTHGRTVSNSLAVADGGEEAEQMALYITYFAPTGPA
jgi:hypothetical protein